MSEPKESYNKEMLQIMIDANHRSIRSQQIEDENVRIITKKKDRRGLLYKLIGGLLFIGVSGIGVFYLNLNNNQTTDVYRSAIAHQGTQQTQRNLFTEEIVDRVVGKMEQMFDESETGLGVYEQVDVGKMGTIWRVAKIEDKETNGKFIVPFTERPKMEKKIIDEVDRLSRKKSANEHQTIVNYTKAEGLQSHVLPSFILAIGQLSEECARKVVTFQNYISGFPDGHEFEITNERNVKLEKGKGKVEVTISDKTGFTDTEELCVSGTVYLDQHLVNNANANWSYTIITKETEQEEEE